MNHPSPTRPGDAEWRLWTGVQLVLAGALTVTLAYGLWELAKSGPGMSLASWQRDLARTLVGAGLVAFLVRTLVLVRRFLGPPPRP